MAQIILIILILIFAYVTGSIPFGVLVARLYKVDITQVGSKNIGATNVLRSLGAFPAALVFVLDFAKGLLPVYVATLAGLSPLGLVATGFAAIIGHTFSVFLKFKGGRGVATGLGVLLVITPDVFLLVLTLAVIIMAFTRYVSLASITCSIVAALAMLLFNKPLPYTIVVSVIALLIMIKHIPNIQRLLKGEEKKIGEKA
jgi:glycerol-3-phosphate acyltransferase PlsY